MISVAVELYFEFLKAGMRGTLKESSIEKGRLPLIMTTSEERLEFASEFKREQGVEEGVRGGAGHSQGVEEQKKAVGELVVGMEDGPGLGIGNKTRGTHLERKTAWIGL